MRDIFHRKIKEKSEKITQNQGRKVLIAGAIFLTLFGGNKEEVQAQTTSKKGNIVNMIQNTDAFTFATNNIDKYYPDMKAHLNSMISSFRDEEQKEITLDLLNAMIKNISDPEQKVGAIIYALERSVFNKEAFFNKYGSKIDEATTLKEIEKFDAAYKARFKKYQAKLLEKTEDMTDKIAKKQKEIETNKKKLADQEETIKEKDEKIAAEQKKLKDNQEALERAQAKLKASQEKLRTVQEDLKSKQGKLKDKQEDLKSKQEDLKSKQEDLETSQREFEEIMDKFSPEDIKNIPGMKERVLSLQKLYKGAPLIPKHIQLLFDVAKQ